MAAKGVPEEKMTLFLEHLADCGIVGRAARLAGVTRMHVYRMRKKDKKFAEAYDLAMAEAADVLREMLLEQLRNPPAKGDPKPDSLLLMFQIKGVIPEFRDAHKLAVPTEGVKEVKVIFKNG